MTALLTLAFIVWSAFFPEALSSGSASLLSGVMEGGGGFFTFAMAGAVLFALWLACSRYGRIRLGRDGEKPEFSTTLWIAMLFSAGMGMMMLWYGAIEPLAHFTDPPPGTPGAAAPESARMATALATSLLHWTLQPWAVFAVVGLALAYGTHRRGRPLALSAAFTPLIGRRLAGGVLGKCLDILASLAILLGSAAALGIGVLQIASSMIVADWTPHVDELLLVMVIAVLTLAVVAYSVSGVRKGIQRLANINMVLATLLAVFVLLAGPALSVLGLLPTSLVSFVAELPQMTARAAFRTGGGRELPAWLASYTIFYWTLWLSWAPLMGMFLARISRGRTVRQFLGGAILVPSAVCLVWFTVFGGTAMKLESDGAGMAKAANDEGQFFELLRAYPATGTMILLVLILLGVLYVSSAHASSTVLATLSQHGARHPSRRMVAFWGVLTGATAAVLLLVGGGGAETLQSFRNLTVFLALPFVVVIAAMCAALQRDLRAGPLLSPEGRAGNQTETQPTPPEETQTPPHLPTPPRNWLTHPRTRRPTLSTALLLSGVVCAGGLWWTVVALGQGELTDPDTAGVLGFWPGLAGSVCGGWGLWASVRGLREQRTAALVAAELAQRTVWVEGAQFRQLLGGGPASSGGRIDLAFTAHLPGGAEQHGQSEQPGQPGQARRGTLEEVTAFYRGLPPGRVLITGTPAPASRGDDAGTGKTVLALALLLGLAETRGAEDPVPVRLSASSWPGGTVREWLHTQLTSAYRLGARDAELLVEADLVLPVIDGLDELDAGGVPGYGSRAAALLRAVERFERAGRACPVVLTCRHAHYQALVDADVQPHGLVRLALARIDPAGVRGYLAERVAGTDIGRERWQPVLAALAEAAGASHDDEAVPDSTPSTSLAAALDTPWRLNLAVTVFQERTAEGEYRRDPAELLTLAAEGRLHGHLLDRYVGAAVSASRHGTADTPRGVTGTGRPPLLDAGLTRRRLTLLARYLDANAETPSRAARTVADRPLSSTDLVLHELWPLAGERRVRWVECALSVLLVFASLAPLLLFDAHYLIVAVGLLPFAVLGAWRRTWPQPRRIALRRLRTHRGLRMLVAGVGVVLVGGAGAEIGVELGYVLVLGTLFAMALVEGATVPGSDDPVTTPREPVRRDLAARLVGGVGTGLAAGVGAGLTGGTETGFALGLTVMVVFWIVLGLTEGADRGEGGAGGHAAVRYLALLLCARGRLPWRLGRFLDDCYRLGILRVAGTAWQFRHRELQDHLASGPARSG
ncbi:BCCT family transporter [Streptomyces sp. ODS28]|uniref:BCCT family transporter n=1 Tax=Streptomyces sp. ODS28 TaxID=3136688 RepID=UPI0031E68DCF